MENKQKILIIDNELDFVDAFRKTLEAKSYEVMTASNEAEARREMTKTEPNLVLLGTMAKAGDSFAIHQWLTQHPRYKDIPLIVIDAAPGDNRGLKQYEGMQLASDDYVAKPIEPSMLVPRIQSLLDRTTRRIKVLVVDDHTMVRDGICAVLSLQKDVVVVGEAVNGQDALDKTLRLMPNVVLMDIVMPVMSGIEATRLITHECPQTKVLILSQYDEEENMVVASQAGARGFIPKVAASSDLVAGIKSVYAGENFPPSFAGSKN